MNKKSRLRIRRYGGEQIYARQKVVDFLLKHLNNDVEGSIDPDDGLLIGSAMVDDLLDERENYTIWLMWLGGQIIAWSSLAERESDSDFQVSTYVSPARRGKGLGSLLAVKMKKYAEEEQFSGHKIVSAAWDRKGRKFYSKFNFQEIDEWEWEH